MALPPLTALRDATITFGGRPAFVDVSVAVAKGERICLVGRNGSGKSTLLKAFAGLIELDAGSRFVQPGTQLAYMPQEPAFDPAETAADEVARGLPNGESLATSRHKVDAMLEEVGIDPERRLAGLSGGEGRRLSLARLLLGEPDVLLLDEPTNHLDVPAIEWLEERLAKYRGAVLMISHDRAFLNRLSRRVLWLDRGRLRALDRGFEAFEEWSEAVLAAEEAEEARLDKKLAVETAWLRQGVKARRTRNMGRVRALQSLRRERAQRIVLRDIKLGQAAATEPVGQLVVELKTVSKSFAITDPDGTVQEKPILRNFSTKVLRGDRVGIVGPNGAGKSTLLKILTGEIEPDGGNIRRGANLVPAYFDQHRLGLDPEKSARENLAEGGDTVFVRGQPRHVVSYLRDFLFDDRQSITPVKGLSGGERNRLLLAKVLAQPSNLLVLDEPTNDLDMETLDLLEEVLADYEGTLILVSHDRDFLDRLATSIIAVEGDGVTAEYVGGWTDYLRQRPPREPPAAEKRATKPVTETKPAAAKAKRLGFREQHDLERLPGIIEALTQEKAALEAVVADSSLFVRDRAKFHAAMSRLETLGNELLTAEDRWLDLELKRAEFE
jgi:ATP-binding cassette subfamily F protein uup